MKIGLYIAGLLSLNFCLGQDIHFSQFFNAPIINNPAASGAFNEDFRFGLNQRVQWASVSDKPYNTFALGADMNRVAGIEPLGAGVYLMHDVTGDSRLRTFEFAVNTSYRIFLSSDSVHRLTAGLRTGFTNRSINYDDLFFDSQYNGTAYDPNLSNFENFQNTGRSYLDLGTGLRYGFAPGKRIHGEIGLGLFNLIKPKQSFFSDDDVKRDRRVLLTLSGGYPLDLKWDILPTFSFSFQGKYKEIIVGSMSRYTLINERDVYRALYGGLFYRGGDAGYIFLGIDYDSWHFGASYDINTSNLRPASLRRGGWEIALIYKLRHFRYKPETHRICPNFMK